MSVPIPIETGGIALEQEHMLQQLVVPPAAAPHPLMEKIEDVLDKLAGTNISLLVGQLSQIVNANHKAIHGMESKIEEMQREIHGLRNALATKVNKPMSEHETDALIAEAAKGIDWDKEEAELQARQGIPITKPLSQG